MAVMESNWQESVMKAMTVRDNQLMTAHQVITTLRQKVRGQETTLISKNREIDSLNDTVAGTQRELMNYL